MKTQAVAKKFVSTRVDKSGMKFDTGKLQYSLIDEAAEAEFVAVLTYGAIKYEPGNWAKVEDAEDRYYDALRRHIRDARRGKKLDKETMLHSLAHAKCCIHFLLGLALRKDPDLVKSFEERFQHSLDVACKLRAERLAKKA